MADECGADVAGVLVEKFSLMLLSWNFFSDEPLDAPFSEWDGTEEDSREEDDGEEDESPFESSLAVASVLIAGACCQSARKLKLASHLQLPWATP